MWAMMIVKVPLLSGQPINCSVLTNTNNNESPVMTSGMIKGAAINPVNNSRPLNLPMCVIDKPANVPRTVAIVALINAI